MTAIQTKGIGVRITSHLNMTKTLEEAWAEQAKPRRWEPTEPPYPRIVIMGTPEGWPPAKRQTP